MLQVMLTLSLGFGTFIERSESASKVGILERIIAEVPEAERGRAFVDELRKSNAALRESTFRLVVADKSDLIPQPEWTQEGDLIPQPSRKKTSGGIHFVYSPTGVYSKETLDGRLTRSTAFDGSRSTEYQVYGNKPAHAVIIACANPACPSTIVSFVRAMLIERFVYMEAEAASSFANGLSESQWGGTLQHPEYGEVAMLFTEGKLGWAWRRYETYFGERFGQLVFLGSEITLTAAEPMIDPDWPKGVIGRNITRVKLNYDRVGGLVIPVEWTVENASLSLDEDLQPYGPETIDRISKKRVTEFKLLDRFDTSLFNVAVAPNAKIIDGCEPERGSTTTKPEEPTNPYAYLWMAVLGTLLLTVLSAAWWKWRRSR